LDVFAEDSPSRNYGFLNKYMINTGEQDFQVTFVANFGITSYSFSPSNDKLQFVIESGLTEENIGEIIIPRGLIDYPYIVLLDDKEISYKISKTEKTSVITVLFDGKGERILDIIATDNIKSNSGGCLIATAAFDSEMAPQVQHLRELRDKTILQTKSGFTFMSAFNQFYYLFSPTIADYERENPTFKEIVKITLTPLLTSLALLQYADIDSESKMLVYGIGIILLNIGMYFVAPAIIIIKIRKRVNIEKLDEKYA